MRSDKVNVEGREVHIIADSEATARQIAALADREVVLAEGSRAQKIDNWFDAFGDGLESLVRNVNRPALGIFAWVFAIVGGVMAYMGFGALFPALDWLFGIVGVVIVLAVKLFVARWARADNMGLPKVAQTYMYLAFGGMALILIVSVAFQAQVSEDVDTGAAAIHEAVEREDSAIRDLEFQVDQMVRPPDTAELLLRDIDRRLGQTAQNRDRELTDFPIGQAVGAGPRDENGLLPNTFCMPNKPMQFYLDKYCPDLVDMEKGLQRRLAYEKELARIAVRKADNDARRNGLPKKSSSLAFAERAGGGADVNLWGILFVALAMLFVEAGMVICQYFSKRHPKGVTEALATLATPAPNAGGRP